jgi:hypothetical protein
MMVVPDPAVREGCDGWCGGVVEAACPNSDAMQDCLFGCRAVASSVACNAGYGALRWPSHTTPTTARQQQPSA